jgi:DNA invertase Pin-like site-specific DNA recombinase
MLIGYMRPNVDDIDCEKQLKKLTKMNCETMVFEEHSSAKNRTQLKNMVYNLNQGDKVVFTKLFALADSTRHLVELLEEFTSKGAFIQSLNEDIDTSDKGGNEFTTIIKHILEFQTDVISEHTKKGLSEAKEKGIIAGRPRKPDKNVQRAIIMYQSKNYSLVEIKNETGISKSTLYRYLEN